MTVLDRRPVASALVAMLAASTAKPCGDNRVPPDLPQPMPPNKPGPYTVVHDIDTGDMWGAFLVAPDACADLVYQVDSVGYSPEQCRWMADASRRTLLARSASGAFQVAFPEPAYDETTAYEATTRYVTEHFYGIKVADRAFDSGGGMETEGKRPNEVFTISERYVLRVVPA